MNILKRHHIVAGRVNIVLVKFSYNFSGTAMLAVLVIFLVGIILMCLGLIALYIANIQVEVMNRPMYVVRRSKNLSERGQNGQNSLV